MFSLLLFRYSSELTDAVSQALSSAHRQIIREQHPRKLVIPNLNYTMKNDFVYGFYVCFIIFYIFRDGVLRQRENAPGRRRGFLMKEMTQRGKMDTYVFADV